jgi:anti-anti-sigma regulatory factor
VAKGDSSGGFLSKVAKFVRHPATSWTDLDTRSGDRDSEYSKAALKEMIERKRRNDFVRKREFDMLRKIRSREMVGADSPGLRPSFFQSSMPSKPDDRAMTLKKIDEIEAQMSMQWWKTKGSDSASGRITRSSSLPLPGREAQAADTETRRRKAQDIETEGSPLDLAPVADQPTELMDVPVLPRAPDAAYATRQAPLARQETEILDKVPASVSLSPAGGANSSQQAQRTGLMAPRSPGGEAPAFLASHFYSLDVQEVAQDPEVEEAAIRFANGDDAGAEQGMLAAVGEGGSRIDVIDDWLALFDLYRATGQLAPFESRAVDFVNRFGRSAPQWVDMPAAVEKLGGRPPTPAAASTRAIWVCDAELDAHAAGTLQNVLLRAPQPWVLDWSPLVSIDANAVPLLSNLFETWGNQNVALRFTGAARLREVLKTLTPSGQRDVDQSWWMLRLAALRVMNLPDDFELAALDYCVTYEMSPPGWEKPVCRYDAVSAADSEGASSVLGESQLEPMPSGDPGEPASELAASGFNHLGLVELSGEIRGDPQDILDQLETRLKGADVMIISCRNLIRVDFSAAGTLLNWVSAHHAGGRMVQFVDVHRLVSAFFHVIGITEYAKVVLRND